MTDRRNDYTVIETLEMLRPFDPEGIGKVRIGGMADGGYVMLDAFRPGQTVISYGVGRNISFEIDLANRGLHPHLFDHTVEGLPTSDPRCTFHREGVGPRHAPPLGTITAHVTSHTPPQRNDLILKMDVECAEWDALLVTPDDVLARFEQIVIELHSLGSIAHQGGRNLRAWVFEKLNRNHFLFHVHSNCVRGLDTVGGLPVPAFLEVTYARRDLCAAVPSRTLFPTTLDYPCYNGNPEHLLWFWPFIPVPQRQASPASWYPRIIDQRSTV